MDSASLHHSVWESRCVSAGMRVHLCVSTVHQAGQVTGSFREQGRISTGGNDMGLQCS